MDIDLVRAMIGRGFRLGLYGHNHKAQATAQHVFLPDRETMAVVSAGSLCAGSNELPTGFHRQYNVIEIAEDFRSANVHVREMTAGNLFSRASLAAFGGRSFATLEWESPKDPMGRTIDAAAERMRVTIERAEELLKGGDPSGCVRLLSPERAKLSGYARQLLIDAAAKTAQWNIVVEVTNPPHSIEELVRRVEACLQLRDFDTARAALDRFAKELNLPTATESELRQRVAAQETMRR
jgi:hypothetical protein